MHDAFLINQDDLEERLEELLIQLFAHATDLFCIVAGDGSLLHGNAVWQSYVGNALSWIDTIHPDDRPRAQDVLNALTSGSSVVGHEWLSNSNHTALLTSGLQFDCRCRYQDGSYQHLCWHLTRLVGVSYICAIAPIPDPQLDDQDEQSTHEPVDDRFRQLVDSITDYAIFMVDPTGCILSWNPGAKAIYGYDKAEIIGASITQLYSPDDVWQNKPARELEIAAMTGRFEVEDYRLRRTGDSFWAHVVMTSLLDGHDQLLGFAVVTKDVTNWRQTEEELLYNAFHDALTGLPNVALFKERLSQAFRHSKRQEDYQFAVLFLDVDRFKVINDSLGHRIGDELLVAIAQRLKFCVRSGDTVARLGGDEFAILLENIKNVQQAVEVADRVHQELMEPFVLQGHEIFTNASIGIAPSSLNRDQPEDLLTDADTAMYRAKALGRGRYEVFDEAMHLQAARILQIEHDLNWVLERQELHLHYQPIISLRNYQVEGLETLVRWQHPTWGTVFPGEFIPVAEETGAIVEIGYWILETACQQMQQWQQQLSDYSKLTISVNLSARQFNQPNLVERIAAILDKTSFDPQYLKLEITESVLLGNPEQVSAVLTQLKAMGIRLAIDDFGTGYSSLSYLHRYPVDTLKIDRSFVDRIDSDGEKLELVRTIITLAWNLGMDVVAEGVETSTQLAQLRALQCESVQGYYFSRPLPQDAVATWLAQPTLNTYP
ncbi:MAG: EAL domain-containing protein [Cyanobacteria bacterium]|nr:EAL domain-containing protein [Cyanobacteriota bacterium]MDW8201447.1 EAL domain-containing protein [Cyanobacteriota bacterium SKYGB_h_bin112]